MNNKPLTMDICCTWKQSKNRSQVVARDGGLSHKAAGQNVSSLACACVQSGRQEKSEHVVLQESAERPQHFKEVVDNRIRRDQTAEERRSLDMMSETWS